MRTLGIAAIFGLCVLGGAAIAQEGAHAGHGSRDSSIEALLVEFASTPAEHKALAEHYRGKAAEARATAASHRSMGKNYAGGKLFERQKMKAHCDALAKQFEGVAQEYEKLAADHEAEAKR